jgi:hypothetical protein
VNSKYWASPSKPLLPIEDESPEMAESSERPAPEEFPVMRDLAEGETRMVFEAETNGALLEEPVEQV